MEWPRVIIDDTSKVIETYYTSKMKVIDFIDMFARGEKMPDRISYDGVDYVRATRSGENMFYKTVDHVLHITPPRTYTTRDIFDPIIKSARLTDLEFLNSEITIYNLASREGGIH